MKKDLDFEGALARLDEIAAVLEAGDTPLEESLGLYAEGAQLLGFCESRLKEAKLTVETLFPEEKQEK